MKFLLTYKLFENNSITIGDYALCINYYGGEDVNLELGKIYTVQKTRQSYVLQVKLVGVKYFWDSDRFIFDPNEIEKWKLEQDTNKYNL